MTTIERRKDVNPKEGKREHGDVEFADPVNKKYPIDTETHIRRLGVTSTTKITLPNTMQTK